MLRLDTVLKPWKEAAALCDHINLYGFWDETTFLTKSGDLGIVLRVTGVDYESLDPAEQEDAVKRLEAALKSFGPGFHVYQYLFKHNRPEIPFAEYGDPIVATAIEHHRVPGLLPPRTDSVHMPARCRFVDAPHYYSTMFHELVHSTGHETRLNRTFGDHFGDELYSKEELVAEMGAAFLCAIAGIANERTDRNTTAYIQNWIAKLEANNRLIVHAAATAQRAVDLILGSTFEEDKETSENVGDAAVSGITVTFAVNIAPAIYGHAHL